MDFPQKPHVSEFDLQGKTAVITGALRGIGRAIALRLASAGADCLIHTKNNRLGAGEVREAIHSAGGQAEVVEADLSDAGQQDRLVATAFGWRDTIDIWINNAGVDVLTRDAAHWSFEQKLEALWHVDVLATLRLSRQVGVRMKLQSQGGSILNMGWDQAETGMEGDSGEMFAAVKGAIMAFSKSLARSLAPQVRVNCLAPGWIRTGWGQAAPEYWQRRAASESLLDRWGSPEDVAHVAHFLVSPGAAFITGQVVAINGGLRQFGGASGE